MKMKQFVPIISITTAEANFKENKDIFPLWKIVLFMYGLLKFKTILKHVL